MKLSELSEFHLAAIVAGATFLGGVGSAMINTFWTDAGTERQTNVQLVQLAIGILSEPIAEGSGWKAGAGQTSQTALRTWAVDVINQTAEVRFDNDAKNLLVNGEAIFPITYSSESYRKLYEAINSLKAPIVEVNPIIIEPTP